MPWLSLMARGCSIAAACVGCSLQDFEGLGVGLSALDAGGSGGSPEAGIGPGPGLGGSGGSEGPETGAPQESPNLLPDPSFEAGHSGWTSFGSALIVDVTDQAHEGTRCIKATDRLQTFDGPSRRLEALITKGATYEASAWVWAPGGPTINIAVKQTCVGATESYLPVASVQQAQTWSLVTGVFTVPDCVLAEFRMYLDGPPGGIDFFVDDVSLKLLD